MSKGNFLHTLDRRPLILRKSPMGANHPPASNDQMKKSRRNRPDCGSCFRENTREIFFAVVPKIFNSRATAKKFSRHSFSTANQTCLRTTTSKTALSVKLSYSPMLYVHGDTAPMLPSIRIRCHLIRWIRPPILRTNNTNMRLSFIKNVIPICFYLSMNYICRANRMLTNQKSTYCEKIYFYWFCTGCSTYGLHEGTLRVSRRRTTRRAI